MEEYPRRCGWENIVYHFPFLVRPPGGAQQDIELFLRRGCLLCFSMEFESVLEVRRATSGAFDVQALTMQKKPLIDADDEYQSTFWWARRARIKLPMILIIRSISAR